MTKKTTKQRKKVSGAKQTKRTMHVITGTHWDREWRYTSEQSKLRLVNLIDTLIECMENDPEWKYFLLDGGTIILDDYMTVRPENRKRLETLIRDGRIQLVNWYTLPDMNIVAAESTIRNLLVGQRVGAAFGGCIKAGYTATSYGQNAQMPQVFQNFNIDSIIFYRGVNKHAVPPVSRWKSSDGSEILLFRCFDIVTRTNWFFYVHSPLVLHKPEGRDLRHYYRQDELPVKMVDPDNYQLELQLMREYGNAFTRDKKLIMKHFGECFDICMTQPIGKQLLGLNMEDNQKPHIEMPEFIETVRKVARAEFDCDIVQSTLDQWIAACEKDVDVSALPVIRGERRATAVEEGFNALLGGVLSSRNNLKIINEHAETALIHLAEPFAALASCCGARYPYYNLMIAWKELLAMASHDNICGAAVDQAHKDMLYHFSVVQCVSDEVTRRSLEYLWSRMNLKNVKKDECSITLFNPLPTRRKGVANANVDIPDAHDIELFEIVSPSGAVMPHETLAQDNVDVRVSRELDSNAISCPVTRTRLLFEADIPPWGYATYVLRKRKPEYVTHPRPGKDRPLIARTDGVMENKFLKVKINPNGTFGLTDKKRGATYTDLHYFTDDGATGSAHGLEQPKYNYTITSLGSSARIILEENNTMRATYRIEIEMAVPYDADEPFGESRNRNRFTQPLRIQYWLTLAKGARRLDVRCKFYNPCRDHRLRVLFPTGIRTDKVTCETLHQVVERDIRWAETGDNMEGHMPTVPMQNFVDVSDGDKGIAFLNKGLREYEVLDDPRRTLAITLMRSHRAYMWAAPMQTHEELDAHTGMHQQFMTLDYRYALYPHAGDWRDGNVVAEAYEHKVPFRAIQGVHHDPRKDDKAADKRRVLPPTGSFFDISNSREIHFSAFKLAEPPLPAKDEQPVAPPETSYILRLWSSNTQRRVRATLKTLLPFKTVAKVKANEVDVLEKLAVKNGRISLTFRPGEIVTLKCELKSHRPR